MGEKLAPEETEVTSVVAVKAQICHHGIQNTYISAQGDGGMSE